MVGAGSDAVALDWGRGMRLRLTVMDARVRWLGGGFGRGRVVVVMCDKDGEEI
jgi:hypothetical protein